MICYTKVTIKLKISYIIINIVILVGDMSVGKSSLMSQYIKQEFPESPLPTIAIEFATKIMLRLKYGIQLDKKNINLLLLITIEKL